jgi:hypothetical protein
MCPLWWKSSYELQGIYYLQRPKKESIPICLKQYIQPGVTYAQITKQNSYAPTNIKQEPHMNQLHQQTSDIQYLNNMMKILFEQMGTMLNFNNG